VLARVRKILSLATSPNAHEAAAAARQARRVLLRHNLRAVHAEAPREFVCGYVGAVKARHATHEQWLAQILHEFFFVEAIWVGSYEAAEARCGTVLQVCGTPQNVALAAYVHASLTAQAECLWRQYRAAQGLAGDRHRARYLAGVLAGFCAKLREQEERVRADEALVWKGDSQLRQFVRHLHPRLRTRQGRGTPVTAIYRAGVAAGRKLALPRGMPAAEARVRGYLSSG